ncbi:MAG: hypothetical protein E5W09_23575 [Mesorhizobium sp.]|nr:hypothetical protein EOA86_13705 [Mesorhizobium sp. M5C.F.Ca.IN.020.32.2.1]RWP11040.1 MAG: hypothetical protein EOR00_29520 [Mesorhizobium sp.]TIU94261.1 MAG: hypothetical protein E5W09_23575 [Mesorhizobium sp.]
MGSLDDPDDLELSEGAYVICRRPISDYAFEHHSSSACSATTSFRSRVSKNLDLVVVAARTVITRQPLLAGFEQLLRPVVIQAIGDPLRGGKVLRSSPRHAGHQGGCESPRRPCFRVTLTFSAEGFVTTMAQKTSSLN